MIIWSDNNCAFQLCNLIRGQLQHYHLRIWEENIFLLFINEQRKTCWTENTAQPIPQILRQLKRFQCVCIHNNGKDCFLCFLFVNLNYNLNYMRSFYHVTTSPLKSILLLESPCSSFRHEICCISYSQSIVYSQYDACVPWPGRQKGAKDKSRGPKGLKLEFSWRPEGP